MGEVEQPRIMDALEDQASFSYGGPHSGKKDSDVVEDTHIPPQLDLTSSYPRKDPSTALMDDVLVAIKKAVFSVQIILLDGLSSEAQLQVASEILTQSEYADVVTERTIVKLCGYPVCKKPLPETFPRKGKYKISLCEHKVYDIRETRLFCSSDCLIASRTFAASLASDRDALGDCRRVLELVTAFEGFNVRQLAHDTNNLQSMVDVSGSKAQTIASYTWPICEQTEVKISSFNASGPADAIEGYVPQRSHGKSQTEDSVEEFEVEQANKSAQRTGKTETVKRKKSSCSTNRSVKGGKRQPSVETSPTQSFSSCILLNKEALTGRPKASEISEPAEQRSALRPRKNLDGSHRLSWADQKDPDHVERAVTSKDGAPERKLEYRKTIQEVAQPSPVDSLSPEDSVSVLACPINREELIAKQNPSLNCPLKTVESHLEDAKNDRLESAEALAVALTEAAAVVASGEADVSEAVTRVGICIRSLPYEEKQAGKHLVLKTDSAGETLSTRRLESDLSEIELDLEEDDQTQWWFSEPPTEFKAELSSFGTIWMALDGWISAASIAYIYGRDVREEDNFVFLNGKEYMRQIRARDGVSSEIERTMSGCFSRALPGVVEALHLSTPISTLEQALGRLLRTMSFIEALPPFGTKQWQMIIALFLDALSVQRLPPLRTQLANNRVLLRKVLETSQTTEAAYETFKDLVLPMGRQPEFAARCGG